MPYARPRLRTTVLPALASLLAALPPAQAQTAPTVPVEVYVGQIRFPAELGARDHEVVGLRTGVDLGAFAGVRGFYWRGFRTDPVATTTIQGYGAEALVNLNVGSGVTPFLVGGVSRIDFMAGYAAEGDTAPGDRTVPHAGGGLRLDLGRVGLQGALRAHFLQTTAPEEPAERDLRTAMLGTAGVTFRLGRTRATPRPAPPPAPRTVVVGDTVYVLGADAPTAAPPEHFVTIPVPREGEIYLRYGPPDTTRRGPFAPAQPPHAADVDGEALRRQVLAELEPVIRGALAREREEIRAVVRAEIARQAPAGLTPEAERRLLENVEAVVALRVRQELARAALAGDTLFAGPFAPAEEADPGFEPRLRGVHPYAAWNVNRPRQFVTGFRLDLGPLRPNRPELRVLPEIAAGFGQGGTSGMMTANLLYEVRPLPVRGTPVRPYGYAGIGFLFFGDPPRGRPSREAVVNLGYGVLVPVPHQGPRPRLFLEHQVVDLIDLHRVIVGVRM